MGEAPVIGVAHWRQGYTAVTAVTRNISGTQVRRNHAIHLSYHTTQQCDERTISNPSNITSYRPQWYLSFPYPLEFRALLTRT